MAALGEREGPERSARRVEAMVARHGAAMLRVANQFSLCHDDALDAYQRALEIYLRRLESVDAATEGAWLRVVVKHEAMAIRRARLDSVDRDAVDLDENVHAELREVDDEVAGGERVERSVEALKALKPDEARALLLKAEGLSYHEIGRRFGWTYTKVNRSITEGRARFLKVFSGLEAGEECERHAPALSALAAGTATSAEVVTIRPHLRHCATCRATVREMRFSRTRRIALLAPIGWLLRPREWFTRVASSDVSTSVQYAASSGGGRLGPAAALIGLCVSGAGAACVMTGALPAPPIIARADAAKPPEASERRPAAARNPSDREPVTIAAERISVPRVYAAATATPTAAPRKVRAKTARTRTTVTTKAKPVATAKKPEFGFEGAASASASPPPPTSPPIASAASVGAGGGGGTAPAPKGPAGKEFGFEGG